MTAAEDDATISVAEDEATIYLLLFISDPGIKYVVLYKLLYNICFCKY